MIEKMAVYLLNGYSDKLTSRDMKDILVALQRLIQEESDDKHTEVPE